MEYHCDDDFFEEEEEEEEEEVAAENVGGEVVLGQRVPN